MRVTVKFKSPMTKNGAVRGIGEELEMDATQAVLLAKNGIVEIPGYAISQETKQVTSDILVPNEGN